MIESSVDLQWKRPSYTGGVALMNYVLEANNQTLTLEDNAEGVHYSPGLVYGEVWVSSINTCGQKSLPVGINIPAKGSS